MKYFLLIMLFQLVYLVHVHETCFTSRDIEVYVRVYTTHLFDCFHVEVQSLYSLQYLIVPQYVTTGGPVDELVWQYLGPFLSLLHPLVLQYLG